MEVRIQAIHFEISQRLTEFINKKAERLVRHYPSVSTIDVTLKVVKPESAQNKEAIIRVSVPQQSEQVATKVADTFEEAIDKALEALDHQLAKFKE